MSSCSFSGNADMYGVGIRVGFYLQWIGTILASWMASDEVHSMRMSNALFVSATFVALILETARDTLQPVEIYIVLLISFGGYLYFVPLYIWRVLTCFNPRLDPSRYPKVGTGPVYSMLNFGLLVAVSIYQGWFWLGKVRITDFGDCIEYGFMFSKVQMNALWFWTLNLALYALILLICLAVLSATAVRIVKGEWLDRVEDQEPDPDDLNYNRPRRIVVLEIIQSIINLLVASGVITATELTIRWNKIQGVSSLSSAGQMIPMFIGIGQVGRILYLFVFGDVDKTSRKRIRVDGTDLYAANWTTVPLAAAPGSSQGWD